MGINFARELADGTLAELGITLTLEEQIAMHLQGNFYPPVPQSMVTACVESIHAINELDSARLVALPEGVRWLGATEAPAYAIADSHRLDPWLADYED